MLKLGTKAPDFKLPDLNGKLVALGDFKTKPALLVMFICNHCPYVQHVKQELARLAQDYQPKGVAIVGINSNDVEKYSDDSPEKMKKMAKENGWNFSYLYDEDQSVAKIYRAACTPDLFLFDSKQLLYYRGQLDSSRPGNNIPVTGEDIREALDRLLAAKPAPQTQMPSMGCNIKWKAGNEPDYFK
jgi:peroxiredoxin